MQHRSVSVAAALKRGKSSGVLRQGSAKKLNSLSPDRQGSSRNLTHQGSGFESARTTPRGVEHGESWMNEDVDQEPLSETELRNSLFESHERDLHATNNRVERLQMILDKRTQDNVMTVDEIGSKALKKEREVDQFLQMVETRIEMSFRYSNCFALTLFLLVYVVAVFLQMDVQQRFSMESPVLTTLIGDLDLQTRSLRSPNDFYNWMSSQLVDHIFVDPICGDGVCEAPEEYAGFGRFGCKLDCGSFLNTTTVSVKMSNFASMSSQVGWDLSRVRRGIDPGFRFNIYSHTMKDFLFAEDLIPNATTLVLELPDGEYDIRFYQTRAVSSEIDDATSFTTLSVLPETLPLRGPQSDFSYGDQREAFAAAALFLQQVSEHCWGGSLADFDVNCLEYPEADTLIKVLSSYGIAGEVTTSTGPRQRTTLASVQFCGMLPDGLAGLRNTSNKDALKTAGTTCGARRSFKLPRADTDADTDAMPKPVRVDAGLELESERSGSSERADDGGGGGMRAAEKKQRAGRMRGKSDVEARGAADAGPSSLRKLLQYSGREQPCVWHDMCDQSVVDRITGEAGMYCASGAYCDTCSFCQRDALDSVDGACPTAKCAHAGGLPQCLDARALAPAWTCPASVSFRVRSFSEPGELVTVKPAPVDAVRFVTPYNRLVGSVVVSQQRRRRGVCSDIANEYVQELVRASAEGCLDGTDSAPFGFDSMFVASSILFNGKVEASDFYLPSQRSNSSKMVPIRGGGSARVTELSVPRGFFPHRHDAETGADRIAMDEEYRDSFLVFLDTRLSKRQASVLHKFLVDGEFLSQFTKSVKVVVPMYNANLNYFTLATFEFEWMVGGRMFWDYSLQSFRVDLYAGDAGTVQACFEIVAVFMLAINVLTEVWDILFHLRTMTLQDYVSGGNLVDWAHMGLTIYAWLLWLAHLQMTRAFSMLAAYPVLLDPAASVRPLLTDPTAELAMLELTSELARVAASLSHYAAVAGAASILFILRIIKALDFQPRLAIVTRSISNACVDLSHFVILLGVLHLSFAATGTLLFGHQFGAMSTVELASQTLTMLILTMDRTQFYNQMDHAAPAWVVQIYLWLYILVAYFLLLNIFLAILVDAYLVAKDGLPASAPITEEVWDLLVHAWKAVAAPKKRFMSDWKLRTVLEAKKQGLPSSLALRAAVLQTVDLDFAVHLPGGLLVTPKQLAKLVDQPPIDSSSIEQPHVAPSQPGIPGGTDTPGTDEDDDGGLGSAEDDGWEGGIDRRIRNLLDRYGGYSGGAELSDRDADALMDVLEQEDIEVQILHHQRQAALLSSTETSRILLDRIIPKMCAQPAGDSGLIERTDSLDALPRLPSAAFRATKSTDDDSESDDPDDATNAAPRAEGDGEEASSQTQKGGSNDGVTMLEVTIVAGEALPIADKLGCTDAVYCAVAMSDVVGDELFREEARRTRAVQKGARWLWEESVVVRAKKLREGEEEKLLTVFVMGEEGTIGEGVLGVVRVNVRPLVEGTVMRTTSALVERTPSLSPEPFVSDDTDEVAAVEGEGGGGAGAGGEIGGGTGGAGVVTEIQGWYRVTNTHRPREVMEHARLHLRVRVRSCMEAAASSASGAHADAQAAALALGGDATRTMASAHVSETRAP